MGRQVGGPTGILGSDVEEVRTTMVQRVAVHPGWFTAVNADGPMIEETIDERLRYEVFEQLMRTAGVLDRASSDVLQDLGLTVGAFFALMELSKHQPFGIAPSELARRLTVARRTATLYVDILTRQGWVSRVPHPDDRRMVLARLTPDGEALVEESAHRYKQRLSALLGDMSPIEAERMKQLLNVIPLHPSSLREEMF